MKRGGSQQPGRSDANLSWNLCQLQDGSYHWSGYGKQHRDQSHEEDQYGRACSGGVPFIGNHTFLFLGNDSSADGQASQVTGPPCPAPR